MPEKTTIKGFRSKDPDAMQKVIGKVFRKPTEEEARKEKTQEEKEG